MICDDDIFANFLQSIYESDSLQEFPQRRFIREIAPFIVKELTLAMRKLNNGKAADGQGMTLELIKYGPPELHEKLITLYNEMLENGEIETTWRHTIFRMIEKKGDLEDPANYRPIAILAIFYKIFAKMLYHRLEEKLDRQQAEDQFGFRSSFRIEEIIGIIENEISAINEYNLPFLIALLDL